MSKKIIIWAALFLSSLSAQANIETRCLDIKLGKNANYSNCKILTPSQQQLALEEERDAVMKFNMMKKQIDREVVEKWRPPMGFSGYSVTVSYLVTHQGTLSDIKFEDYHTNIELKQSLVNAMLSINSVYVPSNDMLEKQLKTTRVTSTYHVR